MKKIEIVGTCKVTASYDGKYGYFSINDKDVSEILAIGAVGKEGCMDGRKVSLCRIKIIVEPFTECLLVNGEEIPLKL